MKKSKLSILLLFLVMILAISAVSAADDTNDTSDAVMQAVDEAPLEEVASNNDVVGATDDTDIIADEGNNFTSLQTLIENSQYDFLSIDKDYTRVEGDQVIEINRNFALLSSGGNYKIDANNLGGIFKVKEGVTFVLQGLTLVNGNSTNGGAIYNEGTLQINSGTILENNAAIEGGAIYNKGTLTITGSDFNQNTAVNAGGAIYSENGVTIINSNFNANTVTNDFDDATETGGSQGGAIYVTGDKLEITGSKFNGNEATPNDHGDGAAIYAKVTTTTISNTEFTNNKGFIGGAVYLIGADQETPVFDDCLFEGNTALQAGAISLESAKNFKINNSRFINNKAVSDRYIGSYNDFAAAAAIGAADGSNSNIYVDNSKFTGNTVTSGPTENSGFGAAIITTGSLFVDNSEFSNNVADKFAAIRAYYNANEATVTITNSNFTSNKATKGNAAAIYASASKTTTVTGSRFVDNEAAGNGGAIYADGALTVEDSYFSGNKANNTANAIYANDKLVLSGNTIEGDEAEIIANGDVISQINVTILNNDTVDIFGTYMVTATVIDDRGNLIADINGIKFVIDGAEVEAVYNATTGVYEGLMTLPEAGIYSVNAIYSDDINVKTATIKNFRGTFKDLQQLVDHAEGTLNLTYNFRYTPELGDTATEGIVISNALTINGNGYTISGSNAARIFNITAGTLTLNNVTVCDAVADNGGAVYVANGATLEANYANFTDNTATYKGGAVYSEGTVKVNHTVFDNNNITKNDGTSENNYGGAAIYNVDGALTVDNSVIKNNQKDYKYGITEDNGDKVGGVITTTGTVRITNSNFTGNKGRWGSSITMAPLTSNTVASIIIDNCNFTDNIAYQGGAVQFTDLELEFTINNCWFENNTAFGKGSGIYTANGGALSVFISQSVGKGTINGTTFINNQVQDVSVRVPDKYLCGGAVVLDGKSFTVENSVFINNFAEKGSAIHIVDGRLTVDNVTFDSNEATVGGAAIWAFDNIDVKNSRFINNNATEGGAIYFSKYATSSTVNNSNFTDNKAVNGGAIYITEEDKVKHWLPAVTITDSKFDGNTATGEGNAIYNLGKLTLARNTLSKQHADIVSNGEVASTIIIKVMNNGTAYHFTNITLQANVTDDVGNLMDISGLNLTVNDTANTKVSVAYNPDTKLYEGIYTPIEIGKFNIDAAYTTAGNLEVTTANITISRSLIDIQNMIDDAEEGATIELDGDYKYVEEFDSELVDGIIINKTITIDGKGYTVSGSDANRMFYIKAHNVTLTNITFANGNASGKWGGAIYVNGAYENLTISDSKFYNNTADVNGGAIYWAGDKGKLIKSEFKENIAGESGGAVFWYGDDGEITGTTFEDNYAKSHGGAVVWFTYGTSGGHNGVIDNSIFNNNEAGAAGGAVSWQSDNGKIIDSTFTENKAPNAGAVYWGANDGNITGGSFSNNNATDNLGGAIFIEKGSLYIESDFYENTAKNGGAVASFATVYIDSDFSKNTATSQGGAIFALNADTTVNGSYFDDNTAPFGGMSIYVNGGTLALEGNFINNVEPEIDIENGGKLTSTIKVTILDGEVKTIETLEAKLSAKVTDDKDNLIKDAQFKFTINDKEVAAVYNAANKLYEATYTLPSAGIYPVNITYASDDELEVENATVKSIYGTFTYLQKLVNYDPVSYVEIVRNYTYVEEIDGEALKDGVEINYFTWINGNGYTIDGKNIARIFKVNSNLLLIQNITLTNGNAVDGGAVYVGSGATGFNPDNVNFINNTATRYGGAIYSKDIAIDPENCLFEDNAAGIYGGAIYIDGGFASSVSNSVFENNTAMQGGAIFHQKTGLIVKNSTFNDNKAIGTANGEWASGAAILSYLTDYVAITDSNFTANYAQYNGAAIYFYNTNVDANVEIDNCRFEDNVAGDSYGTIYVTNLGNCEVNFNINNSKFINNTNKATTADYGSAALLFMGNNLTINGSEFIDNKGTKYSAVYYYARSEGTLTINNTNFTNNDASVGSAVVDIVNGKAVINNAKFDSNTAASNGEALRVRSAATVDITDSEFINNGGTSDYAIYNMGTLTLTQTTVDNLVFNNGTFNTGLNATILDNKTWNDTGLGDVYMLNATLTDDNGNKIYDPNFRFTVDGAEIAVAPKYDDETGLYTIDYTIQKAGLNIVSTSYSAASLQIFTGALDIPLANVTKFTVFVSDILEDENATVWITLIGVNDEGLNSTVTVIVNNKEYPVPVVNGTGNITIENLTHGQYPVVAMFKDPNYNSEINSTVFNVKGQSVLNITELTVAEYGDVIEITINLTDTEGNPISGIVVIDDVIQVLVYEDGIGVFVIDDQPDVGDYTFQAVYDGNDDYFGDLAIFNVTVTTKAIDPEDIVVDIPNINEFGDEIPITITSPVDGTYTVNINGTTVQVEVINGTGNATVTLDKPGIYNATVNIDEEEYTLETITTDDFEYLVTPEFNPVITGTYPNAEITITGPAGTYHVLIDGQEEINITREESGLPTVYTIEGIDAGDYTAFVSFDAHDEYYGDYKEINFTVAKADITLYVDPEDSVEGETAYISIFADSDVNTTVKLTIDDKIIGKFPVTNGSAIVNVTDLEQGQYNVIVEIADDNYNAAPASGSFYVKHVTELIVSADKEEYDYGEDVTIFVALNATSQSDVFTVSITVGEDEYNVLIEKRVGELVLSDLPVGNYTILSYFNGDNINNYTEGKEVTFKVNPKVIDPSDVDCSFEGDYDDGLNITIKSPVDTTYIVDIEGYGPVTVEVNNGTGSAIVNIEEPGDYDANISIADGNYSLKPINKQFKYKAAPEYTVNITGTYPNAKVTIEGTDGNYSVYIDEGHQLVITVKDGVGSQEVSGLFAGEYKAHVEFEEQDGYHSVDSWVNFTIDKAPLDIDDLEVIGDKVVESPINITFTLPADVDPLNVSAYMDGVPVPVDQFIINETTGVYTLPLDGFDASEGHYFVVQVTDPDYEDAMADVSFFIGKAESTVTIEVDESDIGVMGGATVNVTVSNNAAGYIKIDNDGVIDVVEITDGTYSFEIYDLQAGYYYINVTFLGNDKYLASFAIKEFNVPQSVINPNITDVTTPILEGQDAVITVTMDNDLATGNVTVFVDNEEYDVFVLDDYASAIIEIIGLTEGTHTIVVQYNGDDNYKSDKNATVDITVYGNVVINETFFSYFDEDGVLRDNVPFDELIFSGEFSDLGITHVIVDNIAITGDDAKLTNIGFVANGNVALSNMTLIADTSLRGLIYVAEDDVVITGMDISYTVGDEDAVAIDVTGVNNVIIADSKITFASKVAKDTLEKSAMAINIFGSSNVDVYGNVIDTTLIGVNAYYGTGGLYDMYGMMGVGNVNPVRILDSSEISFSFNNVTSKLSDIQGNYPTIQSVLVVASNNLEFYNNDFKMIDDVTAAGTPTYLYSFTFGMNDEVILSDNTFFMSTEGGATGAGTAYALQIVSSNMTIIGNNITSVSNGPNLGIYAVCDYNTFDDFELYIADNIINVTGKATNTTTWNDLVSGIEIGHGDIVIENNIINVYNKAGYINGTYVYGISYAQRVYDPTFDIYDNTVIVPDADYAIAIDHDAYAEVTDNYLIAHELYGDAAVKTTNEESIVIENYPQDLNITVTIENCSVVDPVEISVTTNPLFTGVVIVTIGSNDYEVNITEGTGGGMFDSIPASNYTAVAFYGGDYYFNADEATTTFEVFRLDGNLTITVGDVIVDEPLVVNITYEFADGPVVVYVDDNEIPGITLEDGFATFTIPKENMTAGNHSIIAVFGQTADYVAKNTVYNFIVEKAEGYEFDVNLTIDEIDIGENATINVTLPEDANSKVTVSVDGEEVTFEDVVNGTATVTIPADAFTAGKNNTISVTYSDDKYGETTVSKEIAVNKLPFELTASAENIELGQNATIVVKLPEGADGIATVTLQGKAYPVVNGTAVIENLGEGTYTADVVYVGDSIYEDNATTVTFNVTKVEISPEQAFNITTPENATSPEIKLDLPDDATGFLLVDIDGQQTHVPVVNGTATADIPNLAEGTYNATITYTGDDKYGPITTTKEINVTSNVPENALSIPDSAKSDEPTTYSISLPSDAGGYLEVDVDGTKYAAPLNNGTASVTIPALSEGSHNITVRYTGDDKYTPVTKATTLNVTAPVFKLSQNKDIKVVYSAKATYKVLVTRDGKAVGAGEKVTIKFNGKTYTATTDKNGYATLKLNTKVKVKKYTITATYKGVTVTNKVTVQHVIKAKNAKIKKSKKVNKIKVKTKKVNKKYLKGKKLTLKIKGKKLKAKINKKGVATFKLKKSITKKLKAGKKYKYTVTYGKDKVTKKITVKK